MSLKRITATDLLADLGRMDTVIDARSESEFAEDRLPGAVNWPSLNDAERIAVGTEYKQVSPFDARKRGAALVALNMARHVQTHVMDKPRGWRPLVYCWRGGQRSGALATVLDQIGFNVQVLEGGYREFRRAVLVELQTLPDTLQFRVLCGRTGSAKSRLLEALAAEGAQVLDLEALANHRGSVLGLVPGQKQPSQKAFETQLWQALRALDPARPVWSEGESRTIGRLRLPEPLLQRLRGADVVQVQMALAARVDFLLRDYAHFVDEPEAFCQRLDALRELRGAATVEHWQQQVRSGQVRQVVEDLLTSHYDPVYVKSMQRNFSGFAQAAVLPLVAATPASLQTAARTLHDMRGA
ncbi:MAG: tRNA 2-selenouridine(34) synthase MnmH [Rubrivivax sp.]|nr:tRNA 2-selenouridine(34) synthase MnmH [Rubrivivax sp.]